MAMVRKINDDLSIAGQVTPEQLQEIAHAGFRSVLNLRSPSEQGFPEHEHQQVEAMGLQYVNIPVENGFMDSETANQILQQIDQLAKPILVHCSSAMRAAAIALLHVSTRQGATLEQAFQQAQQLGVLSPVGC